MEGIRYFQPTHLLTINWKWNILTIKNWQSLYKWALGLRNTCYLNQVLSAWMKMKKPGDNQQWGCVQEDGKVPVEYLPKWWNELKMKNKQKCKDETDLCVNSQVKVYVLWSRGKDYGPKAVKAGMFHVLGEKQNVWESRHGSWTEGQWDLLWETCEAWEVWLNGPASH